MGCRWDLSVECGGIFSMVCVCTCWVASGMGKREDPVLCYGRLDWFGMCVV